ncbi:hypothetical protein AMTRI_Chr13g126090 [Amborella trichopoda]
MGDGSKRRGSRIYILLSTNSGQIGVLPNHTPIATAVDIGILKRRLSSYEWCRVQDGVTLPSEIK